LNQLHTFILQIDKVPQEYPEKTLIDIIVSIVSHLPRGVNQAMDTKPLDLFSYGL